MEIYRERPPLLGNRIAVMGNMAKNKGFIITYDDATPIGLVDNTFNLHTEVSNPVAHCVAAELMKALHPDATVEFKHREATYLLRRLEVPYPKQWFER